VSTISDRSFSFNLNELQRYVSEAGLDGISITNHNVFDGIQFRTINEAIDTTVFPGIEVSIDGGHVLIISDVADLDNFEVKSEMVSRKITQIGDSISVDELEEIFSDLNDYLVIPHYDKNPSIRGEVLDRIASYVSAGEVDSAKKFIRAINDEGKLTPVLFSDVRICDELDKLPTRQTFIDCGEVTLGAIKVCLQDKGKVALSEADGNRLFQIFEDGQKLSTGLNVILGERSSGKTYTLNRINESNENVKYIRQFSLVQQDEDAYEREFNKEVKRKRSQFIEEYLSGFKVVLNDVMNVDLRANERAVERYVSTLLKSAEEADRRDAFSKTALFDETEFPTSEDGVLKALIGSVRQLIENVEYREIIDRHLDINSLKRLACELIELLWSKAFNNKKKKLVNSLIRDVRESLKMRTSAVQVDDVDLYRVNMDSRKVDRFSEIVKYLQRESVISEENIQGFSVVARKGAFAGAGEIKEASGVKTAFRESFKQYGYPYAYLEALLENESLTPSELYKLFSKISYRILNRDGYEVSGGERSEFRLLQEIKDAQNHDILLIDEPESSFDNLFLNSDVNQIIREISASMPVVVVTHNSTVGASVGADYRLYASKKIEGGNVIYRLFSGFPTDRRLSSIDGETISNYEIMLNSLEAGYDVYDDRRQGYEAIRD
jgi:ABC-type phosphate transport system ATPase subunit